MISMRENLSQFEISLLLKIHSICSINIVEHWLRFLTVWTFKWALDVKFHHSFDSDLCCKRAIMIFSKNWTFFSILGKQLMLYLSRKLSQTQCDNVTVFFKPIPCINPARSQFFKLKDCCIQMYSIAIKWIEIINLDNTKLVSLLSMEKKLELIIEWVSWFKHHLQRLYNQQGAHRSHTKKEK